MPSLLICVPTYKRNLQLKGLLAALQAQGSPGDAVDVSILVIDNNPDGRARPVAESFADAPAYPTRYAHEARPGVAHVRNRALDEAGEADFLAFIDDDELPAEGWLARLWRRLSESGADAVFGSVEAFYADGAPDWMLRGDFHSKTVPDNGPRTKPGGTDNCLIRLETVRKAGLRFDPALSTVGGEDTLFFDALLRSGGRLANARDAVTHETVPADRATLDWLVRRWRRTGLTDAMMTARGRPAALRRPAAFLGALARLGAGGAATGLAFLVSGGRMHQRVARRLYTFHRGRGMLAYSLGRRVEEYARPDSPQGEAAA